MGSRSEESSRPIRARNTKRRAGSESPAGRFAIPTTLVAGPPGSGKSTWVRERAKPGDLILDTDLLYMSLSGCSRYTKPQPLLPFVLEAFEAAENRLLSMSDVGHAWIISAAPKIAQRAYYANRGAEVVVLAVPAAECIRRIAHDPVRNQPDADWEGWINRWWRDYRPDEHAAIG